MEVKTDQQLQNLLDYKHAPNRSAQVDRQEELISEITTPLVAEPKAVEKKKRVRPTKAQALEARERMAQSTMARMAKDYAAQADRIRVSADNETVLSEPAKKLPRVTADDRCHSCLRHDELLVDRLCGECYIQMKIERSRLMTFSSELKERIKQFDEHYGKQTTVELSSTASSVFITNM